MAARWRTSERRDAVTMMSVIWFASGAGGVCAGCAKAADVHAVPMVNAVILRRFTSISPFSRFALQDRSCSLPRSASFCLVGLDDDRKLT